MQDAAALIALNAVVLDTETTGLDVQKARIIQLGAVKLNKGKISADLLDFCIHPCVPIPAETTAIHGISDSDVADCRPFKHHAKNITDFIGSHIVIGHAIGFDLAILAKEYKRSGLEWCEPRALCTRMLAEIANPDLPDYSMEKVAAWLGLNLENRHTALGDALATCDIFLALLPLLRKKSIRTLAEAEHACRAMRHISEAHDAANWAKVVKAEISEADRVRAVSAIDPYVYRHRIKSLMATQLITIKKSATLKQAIDLMVAQNISSVLVTEEENPPFMHDKLGILTERDVMRTLSKSGADALGLKVEDIMSCPLLTIADEAFVYRAVARMNTNKVRHLAVTDSHEHIVGVVSVRDLLRLRAQEAITLGDEIDTASETSDLAAAWSTLPGVAESLLKEGLEAKQIAAIISRELGALTRQAAVLAERQMVSEGKGNPPCGYALLVLGSGGRGESLLGPDQDNAIIFEQGEPDSTEDRWFASLAEKMNAILDASGLPFCKGGVMARNPQWRGCVETWKKRIEDWISNPTPSNLLTVDVFFDARCVYGKNAYLHDILSYGLEKASQSNDFLKNLAEASGQPDSAFTLWGSLKTDETGRLDLKRTGFFPLVANTRVMALAKNVAALSTSDRLAALLELDIGAASDLKAMQNYHGFLIDLVLRQQVHDISQGKTPNNKVDVSRLSSHQKTGLRRALRHSQSTPDMVRDSLF
jgi:CBS domain-containing protein